ncbi:hypothetical protein G9A89_002305 [Geosiphon pyriformis]|nr:hypothetical protein G9A89_002305 [Geosiphon pyriformis]
MSLTVSGSRHLEERVHAQRLENTTLGDIKELETPCLVEFLRLRLGFFPVKDAPLPHPTLRARRDTSTPLPRDFNLGDLLRLSVRLETRMNLLDFFSVLWIRES